MGKNKIPDLVEQLRMLQELKLEIGILGEGDTKLTMIAAVHEFGCQIPVTDRMRGYLHSIGIHLKNETEVINIPERSYIRNGFDAKNDEILQKIEMLLGEVLDCRLDAMTFYESIGGQVVSYLQEYLIQLSDPPNHPVTVERKGSSNPLIDTERLKGAITYRVI